MTQIDFYACPLGRRGVRLMVNGAHVLMQEGVQYGQTRQIAVPIRGNGLDTGPGSGWFNEKHAAFMDALHALMKAGEALVEEFEAGDVTGDAYSG